MAKSINTFINNALESNWKYLAKVAAVIYVIAFWVLPWVFPDILIGTVQFFARFIIGVCVIIALFKLFFQNNQPKPIEFEFDETLPTTYKGKFTKPTPKKNKVSEAMNNGYGEDVRLEEDDSSKGVSDKWTLTFINSLDWKVFEKLCGEYFSALNINNKETDIKADGGIDLFLYEDGSEDPSAIVQCKKWSNPIKVGALREFYGVMNQHKVSKGYFFTTDTFYKTSVNFAAENGIDLVDGESFILLLKGLSPDVQEKIYKRITTGDYTTPTCAGCGSKMVLRTNKKTQKKFWGCDTYRCRSTLNIKSNGKNNKKANSLLY